jgi:hypothetical protein
VGGLDCNQELGPPFAQRLGRELPSGEKILSRHTGDAGQLGGTVIGSDPHEDGLALILLPDGTSFLID